MAKGAYIGVDSKARKIKKGYIGVDNKARKIKKGYIGVGGVARPFMTGGEVAYYGTATAMSNPRMGHCVATFNGRAIFAGGYNPNDSQAEEYTKTVDSYDSSLTKIPLTNMSIQARYSSAVATTSRLIISGGETISGGVNGTGIVYDKSFTMTTCTRINYSQQTSGAVGTYAVFAGGQNISGSNVAVIHYYSSSLTLSTHSEQVGYGPCVAANAGDYLCFCGFTGSGNSNSSNDVIALNSSLTKSTKSFATSYKPCQLGACSLSNCAIFGGGALKSSGKFEKVYATVNRINADLTITALTNMTQARRNLTAASNADCALFVSGNTSTDSMSSSNSSVIDAYDASFVRQNALTTTPMYCHLGASTGNYILFAGGCRYVNSAQRYDNTVEAFVVA